MMPGCCCGCRCCCDGGCGAATAPGLVIAVAGGGACGAVAAAAAAATATGATDAPPCAKPEGTSGIAAHASPSSTLYASFSMASDSSVLPPTSTPVFMLFIDEPLITSPSICERSFIELFACGMIPLSAGASPLISDMHGLNVTTTSPNSVTVSSRIFTCSSESLAPPTMLSILRTCASSWAYARACEILLLRCASITF